MTRRCAAVIGTILQEAGHEVGYAADGDQGIALFQKGGFDLAIVDLVMPGEERAKGGGREPAAALDRMAGGVGLAPHPTVPDYAPPLTVLSAGVNPFTRHQSSR